MMRVYVTRRISAAGIDLLTAELGRDAVGVSPHDRPLDAGELRAAVRGCTGVITMLSDPVDGALMDAAGPALRVIANYAVGHDNIDIAAATARGVAVANTPDVLTEATADQAWALMMAAARRVPEADRFVRDGHWRGWSPDLLLGVDLHGATLGIFGMGRIGRAVARRGLGFGMRILYASRRRLSPAEEAGLGAEFVGKDRLVEESDVLSIHSPLTPETRNAFGAAEFARMKPSAILVNTSRGAVVDESALASALRDGRIFAAGLDVFRDEPAVRPELLGLDNVVLAPHLGSATRGARDRMADVAARAVLDALDGKRPAPCLNPEVFRA